MEKLAKILFGDAHRKGNCVAFWGEGMEKKVILIVEDDPTVGGSLRLWLKKTNKRGLTRHKLALRASQVHCTLNIRKANCTKFYTAARTKVG